MLSQIRPENPPPDQERVSDPRISAIGAPNGAKYKMMSPAKLPISRSPYLTVPPGLSPSSLLESPVLLTNIKAEPSPTTGSFSLHSATNKAVGSNSLRSPRKTYRSSAHDEGSFGDFEFKPHARSSSRSGLSSLGPLASGDPTQSQLQTQKSESSQLVQAENKACPSHKLTLSATASDSPIETSEDGYNWRKYGQKLVKGCEFPRSYYKCTHPNCQMKKHLERSHDGQITEIIYKGRHDHPKPETNRRLAFGTILTGQGEERHDRLSSLASSEDMDANGNTERSPKSASDDDAEVGGSSHNVEEVADDDDTESKRRKMDNATFDATQVGKTNHEPRVVVQTISEVDILDDGYRWRKYGQKVVKGNPNPRSYYKCTNAGCSVRKHVERAAHDPKAVITTYEGKHNHDVPVARNSSHDTATPTVTDGGSERNNLPFLYVSSSNREGFSFNIPSNYCGFAT